MTSLSQIQVPMDHLFLLLRRLSLSAGVFYAGQVCGTSFRTQIAAKAFQLIKRGPVTLTGELDVTSSITEPTLLFLPRSDDHRLIADDRKGVDVVCESIQFGGGGRNPITDSLPPLLLVPLVDLPAAQALLDRLYAEALWTDVASRPPSIASASCC